MVRGQGPVLIVLSLLLGVGAAWMASRWVEARARASAAPASATVPVLTAAMDIPFGTQIEPRHVSSIQMLSGTAPAGAIRESKQVEGKVTRAQLLAGEILLQGRFAEKGDGSTLAAVVEKDMRAVTVRVDDVVGVAGFLLPGNRVDILGSRDLTNRDAQTETILENVRVLAVDQTAATDKNDPVVVRAVTLEVTPAQAEVLVMWKEQGSIQLTLRNPLDDSVRPKPKPKPAPVVTKVARPKPAPGVTVIRGTDVASQSTGM